MHRSLSPYPQPVRRVVRGSVSVHLAGCRVLPLASRKASYLTYQGIADIPHALLHANLVPRVRDRTFCMRREGLSPSGAMFVQILTTQGSEGAVDISVVV